MGQTLPRLWLCLAGLCAATQVSATAMTQSGLNSVLISVLVWCGAWLCIEDRLPSLPQHAGNFSLGLGTALVLSALLRQSRIIHLDGATLILPLWFGLGLACLRSRLSELKRWRKCLVVMALPVLANWMERSLPQPLLADWTGQACKIVLMLLGMDASSSGGMVQLQGGSVEIVSECTGVVLITQLVMVALIFLLAFPMRDIRQTTLAVGASVLIGFGVNVARICLLAVIHASGWPSGEWWFDFFHKDGGSLLFAGLAACLYGWVYLWLMRNAGPQDG